MGNRTGQVDPLYEQTCVRTARLRSHDPQRVDRRTVLKLMGGLSAALLTSLTPGRMLASDVPADPSLTLQQLQDQVIPYPGKQELLANSRIDIDAILQSATTRLPPTNSNRIIQLTEWPVGKHPNYCDAAVLRQAHLVWVASFGDQKITRLNTQTGSTLEMQTGAGTLPLDVAYDRLRNRVVVASADDDATMIVLDAAGKTVARRKLVSKSGQGISDGGAQGVVVDINGDYWFTLSYHGMNDLGVIVKVDGETHRTLLVIKDTGLTNPNGILFVEAGLYVIALSDNGLAHQFGLDGKLQQILPTVHTGYRGTIDSGQLWVASWSTSGELARIDLSTGKRDIFHCVPLANSVVVDNRERVWVAGDAGLSVSESTGSMLTMTSSPSFSNGLTSVAGRTYHVENRSSSQGPSQSTEGWLNQVTIVNKQVFLPGILS